MDKGLNLISQFSGTSPHNLLASSCRQALQATVKMSSSHSQSKQKLAKFFQRIQNLSLSKFYKIGASFRDILESIQDDEEETEGTLVHRCQVDAGLAVWEMLRRDPPSVTKPSLIVAPTGAGKSGMIVMLPYVLQSKKVLILTPSAIISNQLAEAFGCRQDRKNCFLLDSKICPNAQELSAFLEDVKVIGKSAEAVDQAMGNLVIVNAQKFGGKSTATLSMKYRNQITIQNVETFFAQFDTLIVDEAHHYPSTTWTQIVEEFKRNPNGLRKKLVFLTATPCRIDSKGGKVYVVGRERTAYTISKEMCIGSSIRRLQFDINRSNPHNYRDDIYRFLEDQQATENRYQPQAMVLAKGRAEVAEIVEELNDSFGPFFAVAISGQTKVIAQGLREFTAGLYRVAVTCKVGLEGYDNTNVTLCVILRRIVTGKIMFSQFVGRCMRIRRGLDKINGKDVVDRNAGIVLSYEVYSQEKLKLEYESMDGVIAATEPDYEEDVDE